MFETVRNAFKIKDLRKKIFYTFFALIVVRIGCQLPVPGVDASVITDFFDSQKSLDFFNQLTGGSFSTMSIFALNITPYITASIIIQLLTIAIPKLEELHKDGEEGRKKLAEYTRYLTIALSVIESAAMAIGFGQQGYGYNVQYLYEEIGKILGIDRNHNMVIIGAGNLGKAIVNYSDFEKRGFVIKGIFDNNPKIKGTKIRGIEVRMMNELTDFIKDNEIEIVALTIPKEAARQIAKVVADAGVKAIWNFAHTDLNLPDNVVVENVHLSESLMQLSYNISRYKEDHK